MTSQISNIVRCAGKQFRGQMEQLHTQAKQTVPLPKLSPRTKIISLSQLRKGDHVMEEHTVGYWHHFIVLFYMEMVCPHYKVVMMVHVVNPIVNHPNITRNGWYEASRIGGLSLCLPLYKMLQYILSYRNFWLVILVLQPSFIHGPPAHAPYKSQALRHRLRVFRSGTGGFGHFGITFACRARHGLRDQKKNK